MTVPDAHPECGLDGELLRDDVSPCTYYHCAHGAAVRKTCPEGVGVHAHFDRGYNNPCTVKNKQCALPSGKLNLPTAGLRKYLRI